MIVIKENERIKEAEIKNLEEDQKIKIDVIIRIERIPIVKKKEAFRKKVVREIRIIKEKDKEPVPN